MLKTKYCTYISRRSDPDPTKKDPDPDSTKKGFELDPTKKGSDPSGSGFAKHCLYNRFKIFPYWGFLIKFHKF